MTGWPLEEPKLITSSVGRTTSWSRHAASTALDQGDLDYVHQWNVFDHNGASLWMDVRGEPKSRTLKLNPRLVHRLPVDRPWDSHFRLNLAHGFSDTASTANVALA